MTLLFGHVRPHRRVRDTLAPPPTHFSVTCQMICGRAYCCVSQPLFLWSLTLLWSITISRYREYLSLTLSSPFSSTADLSSSSPKHRLWWLARAVSLCHSESAVGVSLQLRSVSLRLWSVSLSALPLCILLCPLLCCLHGCPLPLILRGGRRHARRGDL